MMMKTKVSFVYLGASVFLILLSLFMGDLWLINTQVAFICSMIIIFASFLSYKGMIEKRLENGEIPDEVDELDKIDDKFGLFNEEENIEEKELSKEEFVKLYKEERKKSSGIKQTFSNLFKSGKGVFNPFRLIAYALLCMAMLFLIRNELFSAIPFLVGIGAVPISSIVLGLFLRK
jgi:hypothetical protein